MRVTINGQEHEIPPAAGSSICSLLEHLGLDPENIVVELNRTILTRDQFAVTALGENDTLELVQFVGGG
jgi:thiamine biosynthesis protein ThiS